LGQNDLLYIKNPLGATFVYDKDKKRKPFVSLIPLLEILTEVNNGSHTKALQQYENLTSTYATEFEILLKKEYEEIEKFAGEKVRQAIQIVRERKVYVDPGYDGVFGVVKIFSKENEEGAKEKPKDSQPSLF